jgi:hypothetical protein
MIVAMWLKIKKEKKVKKRNQEPMGKNSRAP